jgi:hypothetical protein
MICFLVEVVVPLTKAIEPAFILIFLNIKNQPRKEVSKFIAVDHLGPFVGIQKLMEQAVVNF